MTHEQAYALCDGNNYFGQLWNTTCRTGCDLAWAIADQYDEEETVQAKAAIATVQAGYIPFEWEPGEGNTLWPLPEGRIVCVSCRELICPTPDSHGCGCHCPECGCSL